MKLFEWWWHLVINKREGFKEEARTLGICHLGCSPQQKSDNTTVWRGVGGPAVAISPSPQPSKRCTCTLGRCTPWPSAHRSNAARSSIRHVAPGPHVQSSTLGGDGGGRSTGWNRAGRAAIALQRFFQKTWVENMRGAALTM